MKRYFLVVTTLVLGMLVCLVGTLQAQEAPAVEEEMTEYSYGTVRSISKGQIVVSEYDYETDKEIEVIYIVDPKVELEGVDSLDNIVAGDTIEIEYIIENDKKIAKYIVVEKALELEEEEVY